MHVSYRSRTTYSLDSFIFMELDTRMDIDASRDGENTAVVDAGTHFK